MSTEQALVIPATTIDFDIRVAQALRFVGTHIDCTITRDQMDKVARVLTIASDKGERILVPMVEAAITRIGCTWTPGMRDLWG